MHRDASALHLGNDLALIVADMLVPVGGGSACAVDVCNALRFCGTPHNLWKFAADYYGLDPDIDDRTAFARAMHAFLVQRSPQFAIHMQFYHTLSGPVPLLTVGLRIMHIEVKLNDFKEVKGYWDDIRQYWSDWYSVRSLLGNPNVKKISSYPGARVWVFRDLGDIRSDDVLERYQLEMSKVGVQV